MLKFSGDLDRYLSDSLVFNLSDVSMSNTQEGITLPMCHDKKRAVKRYEKRFDC